MTHQQQQKCCLQLRNAVVLQSSDTALATHSSQHRCSGLLPAANDESKSFVFVDGGVTQYNNPAFLLYRMATAPEYRLEWATGEAKMPVISVGTGSAPKTGPIFHSPDQSIPVQIPGLISALMYGAEVDQDISCRTVGHCTFGNVIDREVGDIIPASDNRKESI